MLFQSLAFCLLILTTQGFAQSRGPAVEDFVGIDIEHPEPTPQGTEPLFNFEQDLAKHAQNKNRPKKIGITPEPSGWSLFSILGVSMALGLPVFMWLLLMSYLRKQATIESANNIEILERYRKDREQNKKNQKEVRKAS